jgi:hypothetical protein
MGAWGVDVFDNDAACDYAAEVAETSNLARIEGTISAILKSGPKYLEAPDGEEGLAAADIVARLLGRFQPRNSYTESIDNWCERVKLTPSPELIANARKTVQRIQTEPSELLELWAESGEFEQWKSVVEGLLGRL